MNPKTHYYRLDAIARDFKQAIADLSLLPASHPVQLGVYEAIARLYAAHGDYRTAAHRLQAGLSWFKRKQGAPPTINTVFYRFGFGAHHGRAYTQASQFYTWGMHASRSQRGRYRLKRLFKLLQELPERKI